MAPGIDGLAVRVATLGLALLVAPSAASACSCAWDTHPFLYIGADGRLPADERGITWAGAHRSPLAEGRVVLEGLTQDGAWIPVKFDALERGDSLVQIVPRRAWESSRFRISIRRYVDEDFSVNPRKKPDKQPPEPFVVVQEFARGDLHLDGSAPLELRVAPPAIIETTGPRGVSCSRTFRAAAARIEATIPAALEPFRDYLLYETYVDGALWLPIANNCDQFHDGRNRLSRSEPLGVDVVFSECASDPPPDGYPVDQDVGVAEGTHQVQAVISSPDGRFRLASPSVAVTLRCDAAAAQAIADPTASETETPTTGAGPGVDPSAGASPTTSTAPPAHARRGAGRCALAGPSDPCDAGWLGLLVALLRRRRPRISQPARRRSAAGARSPARSPSS